MIRSARGFTFTELLIALTLTTVVTGGMIMFLGTSLRLVSDNRQAVLMQRELAPALSFVSEEAQASTRLFGSTGITIATGGVNVSGSNVQPLVGFYVPCPATRTRSGSYPAGSDCSDANAGRFLFRLFYLASPPSGSTTLSGPRVLYYADCTTSVATVPTSPTCATMTTGTIVEDALAAQNTATTPPVNAFVLDTAVSGQKSVGTLYLNATHLATGRQPLAAADRSLALTTRVAGRN